jgi:parallel beta-helix repeat protein
MLNSFARSGPSPIFLICAALLAASTSAQVPPVSAKSVGPQQAITCPAGAVDIRPGSSIQSIVNVYPGATTFCLRAGVHYLRNSITPKTGNVFVGEYGATLDGTGWTTADDTQGAFRAHNQDINDVTIRNLVIRKMPQRGIHAYPSAILGDPGGADRWTMEYNEIAENVVGVVVPNSSVVKNNFIHHNVGNPTSSVYVLQGGGYQLYMSKNVVFEHNEISYNSVNQKITLCPSVTFRDNFVHHNLENGIWYDGENPGSLIEGNIVEDNAGMGIFYEVSGQGIIRNNTIRRSGDSGILISTSHNVEIYGNTLENNFRGINYFVNCSKVGSSEGGFIGEEFYMQNVSSHDNTIAVGTQSGALATAFGYTSCTSTQLDAYLNGSKGLTFSYNTYHVPSRTGPYWLWGGTKYWSQWQSLGQDVQGVIAP